MRFLILCLVVLGLAVGISLLTRGDSGYVLIAREGWTMEMSLWFFLVGLVVAFALLYLIFRLAGGMWRAPRKVGDWQQKRSLMKASRQIQKGYVELIEGNWSRAEKRLLSNSEKSPAPILNYLAAAYAAQQRGDKDRRDKYLTAAYDCQPQHHGAIRLTQARMQAQSGQYEQALATIAKLRSHGGVPNAQVARLELNIHRALSDWSGVVTTLPRLKGSTDMDADEMEAIELEACGHLLESAMLGGRSPTSAWESFSAEQKRNPNLIQVYIEKLIELDHHEAAELTVRQALKKNWDKDLVRLYGMVRSRNPEKQLEYAEGWSRDHPTDPDLMLALGRLAIRNEQWGKARSYLETSIAEGAGQEALRELGHLLEELGETDKALEAYRRGLDKSLPTPPVMSSKALVHSNSAADD